MKTYLRHIKLDRDIVYQYALHHQDEPFLCRRGKYHFVSKLMFGTEEEIGYESNSPSGVMYVIRNVPGGLSVPLDALTLDELNILVMK